MDLSGRLMCVNFIMWMEDLGDEDAPSPKPTYSHLVQHLEGHDRTTIEAAGLVERLVAGTPTRKPDLTKDENDVMAVTDSGMDFALSVLPIILDSSIHCWLFCITSIDVIAARWVEEQTDAFRISDLQDHLGLTGLQLHFQEVSNLLVSLQVDRVGEGLFRAKAS